MSYATLDPHIREIAEKHLSEKQLSAYRLWEDGLGYGRIAVLLKISPSSVRDRIHRSLRIIEHHLEEAPLDTGNAADPLRKPHGQVSPETA